MTEHDATRSESTTFRVRYSETDQMGVVYHANYLVWCEMGRTDFMRRLGMTYAEMERNGLFLAVADASVRFHAAARYDEEVRVDTWIEQVRSRTVTFGYRIVRPGSDGAADTKLASATTMLVARDAHGNACQLPGDVRKLLAGERAGAP